MNLNNGVIQIALLVVVIAMLVDLRRPRRECLEGGAAPSESTSDPEIIEEVPAYGQAPGTPQKRIGTAVLVGAAVGSAAASARKRRKEDACRKAGKIWYRNRRCCTQEEIDAKKCRKSFIL